MSASSMRSENSESESGISENQVQFVVEKILKKRYSRRGLEYLVKWRGFNDEENSWNLEEDLNCKQLIAEFEQTYVDSDDQLDDIQEITNEEEKVHKPKVLKQLILDVPLQSTSHKPHKRFSSSKEEDSSKRKKADEEEPNDEDENTLYEVEDILNSRIKKNEIEYEVKWKGYKKTSWEPQESLVGCQEVIRKYEKRIKKQKLNEPIAKKTVSERSPSLVSREQQRPRSNEEFLKVVREKLEKMNSSESENVKKQILKVIHNTRPH